MYESGQPYAYVCRGKGPEQFLKSFRGSASLIDFVDQECCSKAHLSITLGISGDSMYVMLPI